MASTVIGRSGGRLRPIQILLALAALGDPEPVGDRVCGHRSLRHSSRPLRVNVTGRLLPRRFRLDASDDFFVVDEAVEEVVPGF
ncbi:hypothetical protein, partial [Sinorhizobium meliloti]|uniref:hypothetical protein n=1 Tax=Rhizobium meliloti TaxID=382 RepID=UPI001AECC0DC